jgi:hypothetical protein
MSDGLTDFDRWLASEYAAGARSGFTAFVILAKIGKKDVTPLCSTYLHVVGDEIGWGEVCDLFAGSGMAWDAAAFFVRRDARTGGPLDNASARVLLIEQEAKVAADRLAINEGRFFDVWGRRMSVEEVSP